MRKNWVLHDINFQVKQGDAIGIIGRNGAGKSTLLKLLTKTSFPNSGQVEISGRVSALLELGMGFHMDFSGQVNAKMTCQMMGLTTDETHALMPQIKEFSELGDYFSQPMRVYSTGMQVRLAFSAATVIRPEILIVDEALSVGDAYFQHKCINRIREFRDKGTTLLFVSHDPGAVKSLCSRALLLDQGTVARDGTPDAIFDYYNSIITKKDDEVKVKQHMMEDGSISTRSGSGTAKIKSVEMINQAGKNAQVFITGERIKINCQVDFFKDMDEPTIGFMIRDRLGNSIYGTNTAHLGLKNQTFKAKESATITFSFPVNVGQGSYSLCIAVHGGDSHLVENCDWWDRCLVFDIIPGNSPQFEGVVALPVTAELQRR